MKDIKGFKDLKEHYSKDEIAKSYESLRFSNLSGKLEHITTINLVNSVIKRENPKYLLEIATGPGRITKYIKFNGKGTGIDTSESMLKLAKQNVSNKNWKFMKADINKMPFKKNSFDMVLTFRLLIHFTDSQRKDSYKNIKNVLKNKGMFMFDIGNRDYKKPFFARFLLKLYRFFKKESKNDLLPGVYNNSISVEDLVNELKSFKFKVLKIYGVNYYNSFVLLLLALSKRMKFLSSFISSIILKIEANNQHKLKKYAMFIIVAQNEK